MTFDVILERGFSERARAFTQTFGSDELDASNLMMAIVGFLPATDERMLATIHAIAERPTDQHRLVYRYRSETVASNVSPPSQHRASTTRADAGAGQGFAALLASAGRRSRARCGCAPRRGR